MRYVISLLSAAIIVLCVSMAAGDEFKWKATQCDGPACAAQTSSGKIQGILQRHPTPPKAAPAPQYLPRRPVVDVVVEPSLPPVVVDDVSKREKVSVLPWRNDTTGVNKSQDARIDALISVMERDRASKVDVQVNTAPKDAPKVDTKETSPLLVGLCVLGGVIVGFVVYFATQKSS